LRLKPRRRLARKNSLTVGAASDEDAALERDFAQQAADALALLAKIAEGLAGMVAKLQRRVPSEFVPNIVTARLSIADVMRSPVGQSPAWA
jgi:hypothetical protein